jgi:competence protein ComEC
MVAGVLEEPQAAEGGRWLPSILDAQARRAFLWSPMALTFGIWGYFGWPTEPPWLAVAPLIAVAMIVGLWRRHSGWVVLVCLVLLGFGLAKARTTRIATPLIHASTDELAVRGVVEDVAVSGKRRVLIVAPSSIAGFTPEATPRRLRLSSIERQGEPHVGDEITATARLQPLPTPVIPGGFDYGRQLYFEGVGGTGRVTAALQISDGQPRLHLRLNRFLDDTRNAINGRINGVLKGDTAAFAEALIDGERGTIPKALNRSFQASGLAHVLSISGLHMSLVAGGVFWAVRAFLALFPALALRRPIKKWAAVAALAAGLFYMLLAGAEVATQRSYIMIAVVFFAILVDRPALSLRNLALAGLVILVLQPEAAVQASFQMSFLAVLGLAAFFEAWAQWRSRRNDDVRERRGAVFRAVTRIMGIAAASIATTLVAGAMSSIPAAYHFGRVAPYGILGNGMAIPVVSIVVMPMALLSTLLMPLGLEGLPLWIMGQGLDLTMAISDWVAGLPGANAVVPQHPAAAAMITALGAVLLCLLRGPVRLVGVAVIFFGIGLGTLGSMPDILIDRTAANVALLNDQGLLVPMSGHKDRFAVEKWLLANGEAVTPSEAAKRTGWRCAGSICKAALKGRAIMVASEGVALPLDCAGIDIVISDFPLRRECRQVETRIDRFDLWRSGAHALTLTAGGIVIANARSLQGDRPWTVVPEARKTKYKLRSQRLFDTFRADGIRGKSTP